MFYKITNQYVSKVSQKNKGRLSNYQGFPGGSEVKASACNVGDLGSIPRSGRSPGEGNGNSLQYLCQENPTDREAWRATVHRVTESDTTEQLTLSLFHDKLKPIRC